MNTAGRGCRPFTPAAELPASSVPTRPFAELLGRMTPVPVIGATWQSGVTPGNTRRRVFLDGEPVVAAFAASDVDGWVDRFITDEDPSPIPMRDEISGRGRSERLTGYVELRPCG